LFLRGGLAILNAIRRQDFDVWSRRPVVTKAQKLELLASELTKGWFQHPSPLRGEGRERGAATHFLPDEEDRAMRKARMPLDESYRLCQRLARQSASN